MLEQIAQIAQITFFITPIGVFIATGIFALLRFNLYRSAKPSIKIDLEVTSWSSSDSWNVLNAVGVVTNTSRVRASCRSAKWAVRVLAPYDDEDVASKVEEYQGYMIGEGPPVDFPWDVKYRIQNDNPGIDLEPGESNVVDMSLAIPDWITAVDVRYTMVLPEGKHQLWTALCPHKIRYVRRWQMSEKESQENKISRKIGVRRINMDQPVNQKITLPSAEKPAEPPKGKKPEKQPDSSKK